MTFDSGTWWLVAIIATALIGAVAYFIKRVVGRVDDCVSKSDHEKGLAECKGDIKQIREDYTPKSVHEKDFDEVRGDIKKIKEDFITKDDFLREMNKFDRKLDRQDEKIDRLINLLLRERGITNE